MHELSLAESLIATVEKTAQNARAQRVKTIRLALGALAHVDAQTLLFCCALVARDGVAAGATYEVTTLAVHACCSACNQAVELHSLAQSCPQCGSHLSVPGGGDEMRIVEIVID